MVDRFGGELGRGHRHEDPGRKDRFEEASCLADQAEIVEGIAGATADLFGEQGVAAGRPPQTTGSEREEPVMSGL